MNFDFYNQYKDYPNIELLKITQRPDDYQKEAVEAATQILQNRQVSETEISEVEQYYADIDKTGQLQKEKIDQYKEKAVNFFEPVLQPGDDVKPGKWVNILLLVIALQYLWSLYNTAVYFINFIACDACSFDVFTFLRLLSLVYVPFLFYLLLRRKRWGWILLFADNLFSLISGISQAYSFFRYQAFHHGDTFSFLFQIILKGAFVFFLWKDSVASMFGVTKTTKETTAFITVILTAIFIFGIQLFM